MPVYWIEANVATHHDRREWVYTRRMEVEAATEEEAWTKVPRTTSVKYLRKRGPARSSRVPN